MLTGLVIDIEVLSKYCHMCSMTASDLDKDSLEFNIWYEAHVNNGECNSNYNGASGGKEVKAA